MDILDKIDEKIKEDGIVLDKKEVESYAKEIMKRNNCKSIISDIDDQMLEYVADDWEEEGFDSEYDWYQEYGKGEAEDDIIEGLVREYEKKNKVKFHIDSFVAIGKYIAKKCKIDY